MKETLLNKISLLLSKGLKAEHITLLLVIEELECMSKEPELRLSASYLSELLYHSSDKTSTMNRYLNALLKSGVLSARKEGNHYYYQTELKNETHCKNEDCSSIKYINNLYFTEKTINNSIDSINQIERTKENRAKLLKILTDQYEFYRKENYHCSRKEGLIVHLANGKINLSDKEVVILMSYIKPDDLEDVADSLVKKEHASKTYITSALFHKAFDNRRHSEHKKVTDLCRDPEDKARELCHYAAILEQSPVIKEELDIICSVMEKVLKMPDDKMISLNRNETVPAVRLKNAMEMLSEEQMKYILARFQEKKGMVYNPEGYIRSMILNAEKDYVIYVKSFGTAPVKDPLPAVRVPDYHAEESEDDIDLWLLQQGIVL